jgi:hypothetical protein
MMACDKIYVEVKNKYFSRKKTFGMALIFINHLKRYSRISQEWDHRISSSRITPDHKKKFLTNVG